MGDVIRLGTANAIIPLAYRIFPHPIPKVCTHIYWFLTLLWLLLISCIHFFRKYIIKFLESWILFGYKNSANYPKALAQARWVYLERKPQSRKGSHQAASSSLRRSPPAGRLEKKRLKPTPLRDQLPPPRPAAHQLDRTAVGLSAWRLRAGGVMIDRSAVSSPADSREEDSAGRRRLHLVRMHTATATGVRTWASWCGVAVCHWPGFARILFPPRQD